ncbi:PAS domain S-box protein, partial [candidate division KSB1 bacterium]|nr:PAS domain S-box protein [candidate division KSB1 bacterium]
EKIIDPLEPCHPDDREKVVKAMTDILQGSVQEINDFEYRYKTSKGIYYYFTSNITKINIGGKYYIFTDAHDITERKLAEEQIQKNLKEKEILLRELYHRTKNNMQVICSMLRLQARKLEDKKTISIFKEIETKIYSMALVHQKLVSSQDLSHLNLNDYFESLIIHLKESYIEFSKDISIQTEMENIKILMDTAVPLGLVFNELIANIMKHAFPDNTNGEIKVHLYRGPQKDIILEVSDNGIGFPKGFDIKKSANLGLETVIDLVEQQLGGKINFKSQKGRHCKIVFKDELYKPRV